MKRNYSLQIISGCISLCLIVLIFCAGCAQSAPVATPAQTSATPQTTIITASPTPVATQQTIAPLETITFANAEDFLTYTNSKYGFSLMYPGDWEVNEVNPATGVPDGLPSKDTVVVFYSPAIKRCDNDGINCVAVRSEMTVGVDNNPGTTEISEYYVKDVARISSDFPIKVTKTNAQIELSWGKALRLDYELARDYDVKVIREYLISNGKVYIITFHSHLPKTLLDPKTKTSYNEPDMMQIYLDDVITSMKSFTPNTAGLQAI
jgi:hypothetical protein